MSEEKGFSYESPERQKKSAAKVLFLEVGVLVVVVIGIFGLLLYLKVVTLPNFGNPESDVSVIERNGTPVLTGRNPLTPTLVQVNASIASTSNASGYKLIINNEKALVNSLNKWSFFGVKRGLEDGNPQNQIIDSIEIIMTNDVIDSNIFTDTEGTYMSSRYEFDGSKLKMFIYLAERILEREDANRVFSTIFVDQLYKITYKSQTVQELNQGKSSISQMTTDLIQGNIFTISK